MKKKETKAKDLNVIDMKPKKVTEEHMNQGRALLGQAQKLQSRIGALEIQKAQAMSQYGMNAEAVEDFKKTLREKYGDVNVNFETGEISENPKQENE